MNGTGRQFQRAARSACCTTILLCLCAQPLAGSLSVPPAQAPEAARLVTEVLIAGRDIVARNQTLINDPDRVDKGFNSDYFRAQLVHEFRRRTALDPARIADPDTAASVGATIDAAVAAVEISQDMINAPNRAFKGFIPALFGRLTGQILRDRTGIALKQPTFLPRNDYNAPDEYELSVLKRFQEARPNKGSGEQVGRHYRFMAPLYIEASCLQCHGEPRGRLDITGRPMEGYKLGELRGAISVDLPLK